MSMIRVGFWLKFTTGWPSQLKFDIMCLSTIYEHMKLVMDATSHLLFSKSRKVMVHAKTATRKNISKSKNKTTILIFLMMAVMHQSRWPISN